MDLQPGIILYDVDAKSSGILIRRFKSYEDGWGRSYSSGAPEIFRVWAWASVRSNAGRVVYSADEFLNLIKADIVIILRDT